MSEKLAELIAHIIDETMGGEKDYPTALETIACALARMQSSGYPVGASVYLAHALELSRQYDSLPRSTMEKEDDMA